MARVSYPSNLSPEITDLLSRRGALNVMRMMAHAPGVMTAYSQLGVTLLRKGKLDPVLRELAILKIGLLCESEYEWHQHASIARTVGMAEKTLESLGAGREDLLTDQERTIVAFALETWRDRRVSECTFNDARSFLSLEELVELSMTCGYYIMTAGFLRSFDVEIESTPPLGATIAAALNSRSGATTK